MRKLVSILSLGLAVSLPGVPVMADGDDPILDPVHEGLEVYSDKTLEGDDPSGVDVAGADGSDTVASYDDEECGPDQVLVETFQRMGVDDPWRLAGSGCGGTATVGDQEMLTPDMVLEAVRTIGLPDSSVEVPPKTFVNYETTVYTVPVDFARTVTLLGFTVDVRAHASQFAWHFGDGVVDYTDEPGAPYPSDAITHIWEDAHRTFRPRVDTTYTVSYRVDGGPWLDLGDTVTVTGPEGRVRIKEASPALS